METNLQTSHSTRTNQLYAACEDGWFGLEPFSPYGGISGTSSNGPITFPEVNQQALQMDDFARCILNNQQTRLSGEMSMRDVQIIEAILESIDSGQKVMLDTLAF